MFHAIGQTAGEIWKLLKEEGAMSPFTIAQKIKQPQTMVNMGVGWLAREDKLVFTQTKRGVSISLKK
ncbi:MAG: winged helix-turn-helix domain-containing protein [Dehalococcoidia bacterium]|nr:winged helix-turn-helix domain-containing protein [Dehalococcoidia bacterium]